jgi:hypothetical protein
MSKPTVFAITCLLVVGLCGSGQGQEPKAGDSAKPAAPGGASARGGFPDLVKGLKETPGCLGVEVARTQSGKQVIFAWFENKKSVLKWYFSSTHLQAMEMFGTPGTPRPMKEIAEDAGPILVIASITMTEKPQIEGLNMPISQISVELYSPLPGGASMGGTFAPATLKIPGHKKEEDADSEKPYSKPAPDQKPARGEPPKAVR